MLRTSPVTALLAFASVSLLAEPASRLASHSDTLPAANAIVRDIVAGSQLSELRWPKFPDYAAQHKSFYEPSGYALAVSTYRC